MLEEDEINENDKVLNAELIEKYFAESEKKGFVDDEDERDEEEEDSDPDEFDNNVAVMKEGELIQADDEYDPYVNNST